LNYCWLAIVVLIGTMGFGFYLNYSRSVEINSVAQTVAFDLKRVQSKSMIGEGSFKWGIHFVNTTIDYYEIFSTPTDYSDGGKTIISKSYLSGGITFSNPADNTTKDIIFNKISGGTTGVSVVLISQTNTKTISVSDVGNISIQ
jgi:hypothetical protein